MNYIISAEGETLFGNKFFTGFGGKAPNQAVMCKRLAGTGVKVSFIGKLGDDDNGRAYRENFKQCEIETEFVGMAPSGVPRLVVNSNACSTLFTPLYHLRTEIKYIYES